MTPTSPATCALPRAGDIVAGKYRIEKIIGEGGMGIVYAAHHLVLDQRVALKLVVVDPETGGETVERFVREAQAAARLGGEHVVRVTDAGALEGGMPFLVMEFLTGCDLAELLSVDGRLSAMDTADFVLQALSALAQAHAAGIVHRDIKPANLFLTIREDGSNAIKVLDFGISKQPSTHPRWKELTGKTVLGTPAYISPEQLRSSTNVDPRADLWSMGVVIYELLTGTVPFDGDGPGAIFAAILETEPKPLRAHRTELADAWQDIVGRCLQRHPDQRFQTALELARALAPLGSGRWDHLLETMEAGMHPAASRPRMNTALVEAAVAAAVTSFPPPSQPSRPQRPRAAETFATGRTVAESPSCVPSMRPTARTRAAVLGASAVMLVVAVGLGVGRRREGSIPTAQAAAPVAFGARAPAHPAAAAWAFGERASVETAMEAATSGSAPSEAPEGGRSARPETMERARGAAAASSGPDPGPVVEPASSSAPVSARRSKWPVHPAPNAAGYPARQPAGATKPADADSRPKFLKSWR